MFTQIIEKEIRETKLEVEDMEILMDEQPMSDYERGELIDERFKLIGKLTGLELALKIYLENE